MRSEAINHTTPVVVLRSGHHGGLGIARSLGRLGVPVYCVDGDPWEPAFSSRYCRRRFFLNIETDPPERAVAGLLNIAYDVGGRAILIPTTDQAAMWAADNAAPLREVFSFPDQDAARVRVLCDKGRMQELARECGVQTAQSVVPRSKEDVEQFLESAVFPVIVKATDTDRFRLRTGGTKFITQTHRELLDLYRRAQDPQGPNLLIQEFIPGEDWMFDGYFDKDSTCLFGVTGKKIRRFPASTGVTSLGVCLQNETVHRTTTQFAKSIGYRGILDIGYRYDFRNGQYRVLDVNPRIGCTFRLFAGADGMDVARALYLDLTGQSVNSSQPADGRKWIVEDFDLVSSVRLCLAGALSPVEWIKSLRGIQEAACFAIDDPLPLLFLWGADWCELFRWMRRKSNARKYGLGQSLEPARRRAPGEVAADGSPALKAGRL